KIPTTRLACVGLALHLLRVTSRLPKPPLFAARSIYALKQTPCRPPASFKKPVPERPQRLAVKPSSACAGPSGTGFFLFRGGRHDPELTMYQTVRLPMASVLEPTRPQVGVLLAIPPLLTSLPDSLVFDVPDVFPEGSGLDRVFFTRVWAPGWDDSRIARCLWGTKAESRR